MILVFAEMRKTYPVYYKQLSRQEAENMVTAWADLFVDYPLDLIMGAAKQFMLHDTKGFPPVPGQVMAIVNDVLKPAADIPSESEAWEQVKRAISNGLYHSREEYDKLHPILRRVIGGPDAIWRWAGMEEEFVDMNIRPMICRSYKQYADAETRDRLLPPSMQANVYALRDAAKPALSAPKYELPDDPPGEEQQPAKPEGFSGPGFEKFLAAMRELTAKHEMERKQEETIDFSDPDAEKRAWTEARAREMMGV